MPLIRRLVLFAVILAAYLPALRNEFVYDDHGTIAENPFLARPDAWRQVLTLRTFFDPHVLDGQRPLVILSYLADRALFGATPFACHVTNLAIHLGTCLLCWSLSLRIARSEWVAGAAVIMFGLHPALSEAVAIPAFREDLLAAFFSLLFLRLAVGLRPWWSLAALLAALASKESAVMSAVLLAWLWVCFPDARQPGRQGYALLGVAMGFVVLFLAAAYSSRPLQASAGAWNGMSLPWPANLWTAPWVWLRWLKILLVPYPLCVDYVVPPLGSWIDPRSVFGLLAGFGTAAAAWVLRRQRPVAAFGFGWLIVNFMPVSNLVPLFNPLADRYLYLPAIGFALSVAWLFSLLPSRATVLAASATLYAGLLYVRLGDLRSDTTLWTAAAHVEPRSARAQTWLGLLADRRGDPFEAQTRYALADELNPQDISAIVNAAVIAGRAGDLAGAEQRLRVAVSRRPDKFDGWWNLSIALRMQGRGEEADAAARKARAINPLDPRVRDLPPD